jgi:hypothetical protein
MWQPMFDRFRTQRSPVPIQLTEPVLLLDRCLRPDNRAAICINTTNFYDLFHALLANEVHFGQ